MTLLDQLRFSLQYERLHAWRANLVIDGASPKVIARLDRQIADLEAASMRETSVQATLAKAGI